MRNVTVALDDQVARWLRVRAAEEDMSMSRFISRLIEERMEAQQTYRRAMERNLARPVRDLSSGRPYPPREALYDRPGLRG